MKKQAGIGIMSPYLPNAEGVAVTIGPRYAAFWSYSRFDDKNDERWLTTLRKALLAEVRALSGTQLEIFQDIDGLAWGEQWKQKLVSSSDEAVFLIPIVTPSYFASEPCRQELKQFVDREDATGFKESILPLYYIDTPQLQDDFHKGTDYLAQKVAEHNYEDIRELRHRSIDSYEARQKINKLATVLIGRLKTFARTQLSSPSMRASFTSPPNGAKEPREALVSGTLENVSAGTDAWLVVETGAAYHPQRQLRTDRGTFRERVIIGRKNTDHGQEFTVHVVAVTDDVSRAFNRYREDSASFKTWGGVPKPAADSKVLATVKLIRDDSASV
jgi:hypothetical protein